MKTLIAGFGSIGRRHFRNLRALGQTDFVFYRTRQGTIPDEELAGYPVETDLAAALAHRPDAVIVSNPTALHLNVAIPAARQGAAILLEKPIAPDLTRATELRQAVAEGSAAVLVGYQFRFHPGLQQIKTWLDEKRIGKVTLVRCQWGEYLPGWHPWEDYRQGYSARPELGGGVILTLSHPLDYLRWLLGEVESLWTLAGSPSDLGLSVEDTAVIGLQFASGVLGSLTLDYIQRPAGHSLEIVGTQGMLRWDAGDGAAMLYTAGTQTWQRSDPPAGFERNHLFEAQTRHFLAVAQRQAEPVCSLEDGLAALALAQACLLSASEGKAVSPGDLLKAATLP